MNNELIFSLYTEALEVYKNNTRPNNYIPQYIKRRIDFDITNEQLNDILFKVKLSDRTCSVCSNIIKFTQFGVPYGRTCSNKCRFKDPVYIENLSNALTGGSKTTKGKTYKEIYGTETPSCGFKKGDANISKRADIKEKISKGIKESYSEELRELRRQQAYSSGFISNSYGKKYEANDGLKYRSSLEVEFVNLMIEHDIPYEYEVHVKMINSRTKIVDFKLYDNIYVEVTGYSYKGWQEDFDSKLQYLRKSLLDDDFIMLLTYDIKIDTLFENTSKNKVGKNIFIGDIKDKDYIIRTIKFILSMNMFRKEMNVNF